jgi:hypothetical protein
VGSELGVIGWDWWVGSPVCWRAWSWRAGISSVLARWSVGWRSVQWQTRQGKEREGGDSMSGRAGQKDERSEQHPVGTLFLTLLMLIVIVGIWLTFYFDMLGRG